MFNSVVKRKVVSNIYKTSTIFDCDVDAPLSHNQYSKT